jgi:hypothetical protein
MAGNSQFRIRLPDNLHDRLLAEAAQLETDISTLVSRDLSFLYAKDKSSATDIGMAIIKCWRAYEALRGEPINLDHELAPKVLELSRLLLGQIHDSKATIEDQREFYQFLQILMTLKRTDFVDLQKTVLMMQTMGQKPKASRSRVAA